MPQLRALGTRFGKEELEGIDIGGLGEVVEGGLEGVGRVGGTFAERSNLHKKIKAYGLESLRPSSG